MEKFNGATEPMELEFFTVMNDGRHGKEVHLDGYLYQSEDNGEGAWRLLEPCGVFIPIAEFVQNVAKEDGYTDRLISEAKQYIEDMDDDGVVECINEFYNGQPADYVLQYNEVTEETPCGHYCFEI
ncbi:MAG: hypothetical protein IK144_12030 [Bacteroidaceae bacterium]|nr:hypothetical protein [Bacteroidaceae bacterium]